MSKGDTFVIAYPQSNRIRRVEPKLARQLIVSWVGVRSVLGVTDDVMYELLKSALRHGKKAEGGE